MSASREKKNRQERGSGFVSPRQEKEREEQAASRRTTLIFTVCASLLVAFVVFAWLNNSGVFKRTAKAAVINGKTYSVADVAYHYYNARSSILSSHSDDLDNASSLRAQAYTEGEDFDTWFDYALDQSCRSLAVMQATLKAAKEANYQSDEVKKSVHETMDTLKTNAASSGYALGDYVKAIFGGLVTRGALTKYLSDEVLANAYVNEMSQPSSYTEAQLRAEREGDPSAYDLVEYEALLFYSASFATEATETEKTDGKSADAKQDDGSAAAKAAAQKALTRYRSGRSLKALADELDGSYVSTFTTRGGDSAMLDWLFDDARKAGDTGVLDYDVYGSSMGSVLLVFRNKALADYHTVNVRHILVEDEESAKDILAEYEAGEKTEDAFAALATEHSTDPGSSENGGLYENIYKGQMVKPFETWCFEEGRQVGDTGIVQTDYGYHVMYFVSRNEYAYWQQMAASKLAAAWKETLQEVPAVEQLDGMKYIDP